MVNPRPKPLSHFYGKPIYPVVDIPIEELEWMLPPHVAKHPEYLNSKRMSDLREEIKKNGILEPIIVRYNFLNRYPGKYTILKGNHRFFLAKELGIKSLKCITTIDEIEANYPVPLGPMMLPIDKLFPSLPHYNNETTRLLKEDILKNGIRDEIEVCPTIDCRHRKKTPYQITNGNHRYWIAKELGYKFMKCYARIWKE